MPPTRVLIYPMPRLLQDILYTLASDVEEVELVGCPDDATGIDDAAVRTGADLVIACDRDAAWHAVDSLLKRMPRTRALAVSADGRSGVLYELRPVRRVIGELSAATLRAAVAATAVPFELPLPDPTPRPAS